MLKTNSMRPVISFTDLLPYMGFGLMTQDAAKETRIVSISDDAGRRQGNEDRIHQRRQYEDLMRDCNRAVKKSITPPVATDADDVGDVSGVAPISDDGSVDSSL